MKTGNFCESLGDGFVGHALFRWRYLDWHGGLLDDIHVVIGCVDYICCYFSNNRFICLSECVFWYVYNVDQTTGQII